jgi:hypothetical protein
MPHPSMEVLDEYLLDRLSQSDVAAVETHLLACIICVQHVEDSEDFIRVFKATFVGGPAPTSSADTAPQDGAWACRELAYARVE